MVIDTEGLLTILFDEPLAPQLERALVSSPTRLISALTLFEAAIVIGARFGEAGTRELDLWLQRAAVHIVPVDVEQVHFARQAWPEYEAHWKPVGGTLGDFFSAVLARLRFDTLLSNNPFP